LAVVGAVTLATLAVIHLGGWSRAVVPALVEMGFDPDRAILISAILAAATTCAAVTLVTGQAKSVVALSPAILAATFGRTFLRETTHAVAGGAAGGFSVGGWLLTIFVLLVAAVIVGAAGAGAGSWMRAQVVAAGRGVVRALRGGRLRGTGAWRAPVAVMMVVAVVVCLRVLGDMLNYEPDALMRGGAVSLASTPPSAGDLSADSTAAAPKGQPWLHLRPRGSGSVRHFELPAPWVDGLYNTAAVTVYLPPGYDQGSQQYPVIYETPGPFDAWARGANVAGQLDAYIDAGTLPATIMVWAQSYGGPYGDSECVNSFDGREHFATWIAHTIVGWVEQHFRTIRSPLARTLTGYSQGGYCAANLLMQFPEVFGQTIAFNGYYRAAPRAVETVNAWRPFGNDAALEAAQSPVVVAPRLDASLRHDRLVILVGNPAEGFYGPQLKAFVAVLARSGYPHLVLATPLGHSWASVRAELEPALMAVAEHQAGQGLFS
jgi:enterochelin esterase-like enzyme